MVELLVFLCLFELRALSVSKACVVFPGETTLIVKRLYMNVWLGRRNRWHVQMLPEAAGVTAGTFVLGRGVLFSPEFRVSGTARHNLL